MRVIVENQEVEVIVLEDGEALARQVADRFRDMAGQAVASRGRFSVALSGGSTPLAAYRRLAAEPYRDQVPWQKVHLFWGDERCVPPNHPESNYGQAEATLISRVPIPSENVHRVRGEMAAVAAARAYESEMKDFFCGPAIRFDLVLLGLGSDGHTAALFPDSPALKETAGMTAAVEADYDGRPARRVTLTLPAINAAREILFLVSGSDKAEIVREVLGSPAGTLPAQLVYPVAGGITWLLDQAAAAGLGELPGSEG